VERRDSGLALRAQWEADIAVRYARDGRWTQTEAVLLARAAIVKIHDEVLYLAAVKGDFARRRRAEYYRRERALCDDWRLRL
jgi:hypothetical protein